MKQYLIEKFGITEEQAEKFIMAHIEFLIVSDSNIGIDEFVSTVVNAVKL